MDLMLYDEDSNFLMNKFKTYRNELMKENTIITNTKNEINIEKES